MPSDAMRYHPLWNDTKRRKGHQTFSGTTAVSTGRERGYADHPRLSDYVEVATQSLGSNVGSVCSLCSRPRSMDTPSGRGKVSCDYCEKENDRLAKALARQYRRWYDDARFSGEDGAPFPPFSFDPVGEKKLGEKTSRIAALTRKAKLAMDLEQALSDEELKGISLFDPLPEIEDLHDAIVKPWRRELRRSIRARTARPSQAAA